MKTAVLIILATRLCLHGAEANDLTTTGKVGESKSGDDVTRVGQEATTHKRHLSSYCYDTYGYRWDCSLAQWSCCPSTYRASSPYVYRQSSPPPYYYSSKYYYSKPEKDKLTGGQIFGIILALFSGISGLIQLIGNLWICIWAQRHPGEKDKAGACCATFCSCIPCFRRRDGPDQRYSKSGPGMVSIEIAGQQGPSWYPGAGPMLQPPQQAMPQPATGVAAASVQYPQQKQPGSYPPVLASQQYPVQASSKQPPSKDCGIDMTTARTSSTDQSYVVPAGNVTATTTADSTRLSHGSGIHAAPMHVPFMAPPGHAAAPGGHLVQQYGGHFSQPPPPGYPVPGQQPYAGNMPPAVPGVAGSDSRAGPGPVPAGPLAGMNPYYWPITPAINPMLRASVDFLQSQDQTMDNTAGLNNTQKIKMAGSNNVTNSILSASTDVQSMKEEALLEGLRLDWKDITLKSRLASGGFGVVWVGKWQGFRVAVKLLSVDKLGPAVLQELHQEALIMSELRHPCIARVYGLVDGKDESGQPVNALVMHFYKKGTLTRFMGTSAYCDMSLGEKLQLARQVAAGMRFLHSKRPNPILHLDLKSSNLLVEDDGRLVIADFGLSSTLAKSDTSSSPCTAAEAQTSGALTVSISPPEVLKAPHAPRGPAVDVYAFGIVLLEIMTGQPAYRNIRAEDLRTLVLQGRRPMIPTYVPADLAQVITDCWAQDASARPTFNDIVLRLDDATSKYCDDMGLTTTTTTTEGLTKY